MYVVARLVPNLGSFLPLLLFILSVAIGIAYYRTTKSRTTKLGSLIPGPPPLPFIGNALLFVGFSPEQVFKNVFRLQKYGRVIRCFFFGRLIVALTDPKDIEVILGSQVHIDKMPEYKFFGPLLGDGVLRQTGEKWRQRRRMIAPTFRLEILKTFVNAIHEHSVNLVERLRREVGREFDCHDEILSVTVDILLETVMGIHGKNVANTSHDYAMAVMRMCDIVHRRAYDPRLRFEPIFKLTGLARQQEKIVEITQGLVRRTIVRKKREYAIASATNGESTIGKTEPQAQKLLSNWVEDHGGENDVGEKKRLAFLDMMLENLRNGADLVDADIVDEVNNIMLAGHDTTAAASGFVLSILGVHQDVQEKVVRELEDIFKGSDRPVTYDDTVEMKYFERVIMETLRLYPPVPAIGRLLTRDVRLVTGDYLLPAGTSVVIPSILVHRLPEFCPNPEVFDPDNFLPERTQNRHYYSYIPFSAGPRSCLGRKYAILTLKIVLATILRNYKILSDQTEKDFQLRGDIILKPTDGFRIRIEPRL